MDTFNDREIAIGLWLLAFSAYILFSSKGAKVRKSIRHLFSTFFVKQIMVVLGLMITYIITVVYLLSELDLWNIGQIKNTVFWSISIGFMSLFKIESIKKDKSFFKHSVVDNLKLLAILQFIFSFYTFPILIEIILVPVLAVIGGMSAIAESDEKYRQVKTVLEYCLSFFGLIVITYTLYMLTTNFNEFGNEKTAYDFFVPPLLTLCYLPFIFIMLVYSTYEQVFVRLQYAIKSKFHRNLAKLYAVILFNFRMTLLDRWSNHVRSEKIESHEDLVGTFRYIFKVLSAERNPKDVPSTLGWSPYKAKNFLSGEGLCTGFYDRRFDSDWSASSQSTDISDGLFPDKAIYRIEGSEDVSSLLKVIVYVNDGSRSLKARKKMEQLANTLSLTSLNQPLSKKMIEAITQGRQYSEKIEEKDVSLEIYLWSNHKLNGYEIKFCISCTS